MTLIEFLILLVVAGVCGALGQSFAGNSRGGCVLAIGIGFLGAWAGTALANAFALPVIFAIEVDGRDFPVVWSIAGATLIVGLLSFLGKERAG